MASTGTHTTNDFVVEWQGDEKKTTQLIIQRLFMNEIEGGKPLLVVVTGKSGTGKSYTTVKVQDWLYKKRNMDFADFMQHVVVLSPLDYGKQIKEILRSPYLRRVFTVHIDEGRFVVGAENWGTFVNASIGHVNASARAIKTMITFIVTQSLRDIDKKLRDAVDIQMICKKHQTEVYVSFRKFWIDDSDVEKPRLRYRVPTGVIRFPDGTTRRIRLTWKPEIIPKELSEPYETMMQRVKGGIIDLKMDKLIERIKKDLGERRLGLVEQVADMLATDTVMLGKLGKMRNHVWLPDKEKMTVFGLNKEEMKEMRKSLQKKLRAQVEENVAEKSIKEI